MNPQTQKESDLLALLDKSEEEQKAYLISNKIMQYHPLSEHIKDATYSLFPQIWESLADLAERLWSLSAEKLCSSDMTEVMKNVYVKVYPKSVKQPKATVEFFFLYIAKPIHRIIAALIALKRSGVEELTNL